MTLDWPDLIKRLSAPFPASTIYWRAGTVSKDKKRAQALPYAEPRAYEDRLNSVCPGLWSVTFQPWGDSRIICNLMIAGVTRSSTGEETEGFAPGTAAEAQAFKRACSKFGLGRYLYDIPIDWVAYDGENRRLLEVPSLPERFLPQAEQDEKAAREPVQAAGESRITLSQDRARAMYRELNKLGFSRAQQHEIASGLLGHAVENFTSLTEGQALEVWKEARREVSRRALNP